MIHRIASRRVMLGAAALAASALLAGCYVVPVAPGPGAEVVTEVPPPPPQVEVYGPPPVVGQIWIGGYWNWGGARFVWMPGYWATPRPGYYWRPHQWVPHRHGWRLDRGHWSRR